MLNKIKYSMYMPDDNIGCLHERYNEHHLLSRFFSRENIDKLKITPWFKRRNKWKIPFSYKDFVMIREAIENHPDNWDLFLTDTIRLSESRHWIDWIITETYECWHNDNHGELNNLKHKYNKYSVRQNQLSALVALYKNNAELVEEKVIAETENKLSECKSIITQLKNNINVLQQSVLFSLRDMYDAFRATIYHNNTLKHNHYPEELQIFIDSILLLKEKNNNESLYNWLCQKNICSHNDILSWY